MRWYLMAALAAFVLSWLTGLALLPLLKRLKAGQPIRNDGPKSHLKKAGVPTMGGLQFVIAGLAAAGAAVALLFRAEESGAAWDFLLIGAVAVVGYGFIGFLDDFIKVRSRASGGLMPRYKLLLQFALSIGLAWVLWRHPLVGSSIKLPFVSAEWDLGWWYVPLMTLALVFMTNSANLLDGLDGLLGGVATLDLLTYAILALLVSFKSAGALSENTFALGLFCASGVGALLGFLRFNSHPALVIMGDTGSMALGGWVTIAALLTRTPLLLLMVGLMMALSSLSVILQVISVKLTGQRLFRMSPLHHHFELGGTPETRIVSMYTLVTAAMCMLALLSVEI